MVAGFGPQPALGLICGEAPGRQEVQEGKPFVGKAGRLLDTALKALGVDRETLYITNVCKDLPLDSEERIRRPTKEEIEAWRPVLEKEIQNTAPAAILALGKTAANVLTGLEGAIPWGSRVGIVSVAWHPSYLLHNGQPREMFEEWIDMMEEWAEVVNL